MGEFRFCDKCSKPITDGRKNRYISTRHISYWNIDATLFQLTLNGKRMTGIFHICEDCAKPILDYMKLEKAVQ